MAAAETAWPGRVSLYHDAALKGPCTGTSLLAQNLRDRGDPRRARPQVRPAPCRLTHCPFRFAKKELRSPGSPGCETGQYPDPLTRTSQGPEWEGLASEGPPDSGLCLRLLLRCVLPASVDDRACRVGQGQISGV